MLNVVIAAVPPLVYLAVKINVNRRGRTLFEPYSASGQPKIGHLGLPAVNQLLTKNTKLIAYTVAHCRVASC